MKIGLLALQGAIGLHASAFARLDIATIEVRTPADLADVDALVIPGGESTTISQMLDRNALFEPIARRLVDGMPAFGTCAGMIMLARNVLDGRPDQRTFGVVEIDVRRNAFGRQIDSFETDLVVQGIAETSRPVHAVFIRAPVVEFAGANVEVLATVEDHPVCCRQGRVLVTAFHPELSDDCRIHEAFVLMIERE